MSVTLHTGLGDVKIELYCRQVPLQAANFLALCASGVYTNTIFHRVFPGFMAQAGDPTGTGKTSRAAFAKRLPDEIAPSLTFARAGVVAFANNGRPSRKGVGSQFFITVTAARHLDVTCTIVGKVIWGLAVVKNICAVATDEGRPKDDVRIEAVTIHANPFASGDIELELPASAKGGKRKTEAMFGSLGTKFSKMVPCVYEGVWHMPSGEQAGTDSMDIRAVGIL